MIIVGIDQTLRSRQLLRNSGIPVVQTFDVSDVPIDMMIGFDHRAAGKAAVQYLQKLGHRRIAHLTVHTDPRASRRLAGYRDAMAEMGMSIDGLVSASPHPSTAQRGAELFSEVLARAPDITAIFTCNDDLALGTLFECSRRGIRVPEDMAIIGFNDLDFCETAVPPLSSVATERGQAGTWAGKAVLEVIRGSGKRPKNAVVDIGFSIKERGSSTPMAATKPAARRRPAPART